MKRGHWMIVVVLNKSSPLTLQNCRPFHSHVALIAASGRGVDDEAIFTPECPAGVKPLGQGEVRSAARLCCGLKYFAFLSHFLGAEPVLLRVHWSCLQGAL